MSPNEENHSSVISFNIKGIHPHDVASMLDFKGVCVHFGDGGKNVQKLYELKSTITYEKFIKH